MPDGPTPTERRAAATSDTGAEPEHEHQRPFWRELPILVIAALTLAIVIKTFLVQAFYIPSSSMEPTMLIDDRILVCRICLRFGDPTHGDVIVFADPDPGGGPDRGLLAGALHWFGEGIGVAQPDNDDFIKRVGGLPGDLIEIRRGTLYRNGERILEAYLHPAEDTRSFGLMTVPDGMLFVLGDNRLSSGDSRFDPPTGVGLIPIERVVGKAFVIVWPVTRWGGVG